MGHRVPFVIEPILWSCLRAAVKNLYSPFEGRRRGAPGRVEYCCPVSHRYSLIYASRLAPGRPVIRDPTITRKKPRRSLFWGTSYRGPSAPPPRGVIKGMALDVWAVETGRSLVATRSRASANICHLLSLSPRKQRGV